LERAFDAGSDMKDCESEFDFNRRGYKPFSSFDEWYEGDRGIAASTYIGINLLLLKEFYINIGERIKFEIDVFCINLINFLEKKDDLIKINHQAAIIYFFCLAEKSFGHNQEFKFNVAIAVNTTDSYELLYYILNI
jgi:hypothetical protein